MYKYLIIGIALMFTLAGGYYINKSGGGELLGYMISGEKPSTLTPLNSANIPGLYVCDAKSGCDSKYVLLLRNDQTAEMTFLPDKTDSAVDTAEETNSTEEMTTATVESATSDTSTSSEDSKTEAENTTERQVEIVPPSDADTLTEELFSPEEETEPNPNKNKGTWDIAVQNMLVITLNTQGTTTYDVPQKIVVKNVGATSLSKISYTKSNYTEMIQPTFIRQE